MKTNVGTVDRIVRLVLAAVFAYLAMAVHAAFWIAAVVAVVTAALGFCGIYAVLGTSTCPASDGKTRQP